MKKILLFITALIITAVTFGQNCTVNSGTKTLYTATPSTLSLPPGYRLVFVNHAGRHGARHLTKDPVTAAGYLLLKKADSLHLLTMAGEKLKEMIEALNLEEHNYTKSISARGKEEQQGIAKRLYQQDSIFFNSSNFSYHVQVTKEIRTSQTAAAFLEVLRTAGGKRQKDMYKVNDTVLRFYDLAPAYLAFEQTGTWKNDLDGLRKKIFSDKKINKIIARFFAPGFLSTLDEQARETFVTDIQGFITIIPGIQQELNEANVKLNIDSLQQFFSCKELEAMGRIDRAEDFLLKGPGLDNNGIQVKIAAPLLVDFIRTTDDFVEHRSVQSQFRFSHAETIAPFAALLQLEGTDKAVTDIRHFSDDTWDAAQVVPLSANIQWLIYRDEKGSYQLRCLLNEKDVHITGLDTNNFPFYKWDEVRNFYLQKLAALKLGLSDDLLSYLRTIK